MPRSDGWGNKRRQVEDTQPISWEDIALKCHDIEEPRDSCLIALLYLSGRRVSEVLHLQRKDVKVDENRISFECFNEKVYRKKQTGNFSIFRNNRYYEKIHPHWRTDTDSGKALSVFVVDRLGSLSSDSYLFGKLRGPGYIGRRMAHQLIHFYLPDCWPHLLRHERFTEAAKVYRADPVAMHRFTFHKRFESTMSYIRDQEEEKI